MLDHLMNVKHVKYWIRILFVERDPVSFAEFAKLGARHN